MESSSSGCGQLLGVMECDLFLGLKHLDQGALYWNSNPRNVRLLSPFGPHAGHLHGLTGLMSVVN